MKKIEFKNNEEAVHGSMAFILRQGFCINRNGYCVNKNDEGKMCAFSCLLFGRIPDDHLFWTSGESAEGFLSNKGWRKILPTDITRLSIEAMIALQRWHDFHGGGAAALDPKKAKRIKESAIRLARKADKNEKR